MKPTKEEAEAEIKKHLDMPANKRMKEWYESGLDIREFVGAIRNPLHWVKVINNKWKLVGTLKEAELEPYSRYLVEDTTSEEEVKTKYVMLYFEDKFDFEASMDLYRKYKCPEYINRISDYGEQKISSVEEMDFYFIIVDNDQNTLRNTVQCKEVE